jgi:hypothetical protein
MKRCSRCNRTYSDDNLNFCLEDGELLTHYADEEPTRSLRDNPPPTVVMDPTRVTNPISWPQGQPMQQQWPQSQPVHQPNYAFAPHPMMMRSPNQTLPLVSLCLGIGSMTIGWCCSLGLLLAPAAMITGGIALAQNKKNPDLYGGKGLAVGGIVVGGAFLVLWLIFMILWGIANLLPAFLQTR